VAAYGRKGDIFRFYEIDPLVEQIARNLFSYLRGSEATIQVVLGDARVSLAAESSQQFDVLVVDAFSGDAPPVHLLTAEAFALYRRHLKPDGILAFDVTNRYLDLAQVVQKEANHAGLRAILVVSNPDMAREIYSANWVLVTGNKDFLLRPELLSATRIIKGHEDVRLWSDDYHSLLPVVRWKPSEQR
jgi:spermidine synthase